MAKSTKLMAGIDQNGFYSFKLNYKGLSLKVRMSSILIKLLERWTALTLCRRKQKHILHKSTFYSKPLKPNTQILNTDSQETLEYELI